MSIDHMHKLSAEWAEVAEVLALNFWIWAHIY